MVRSVPGVSPQTVSRSRRKVRMKPWAAKSFCHALKRLIQFSQCMGSTVSKSLAVH